MCVFDMKNIMSTISLRQAPELMSLPWSSSQCGDIYIKNQSASQPARSHEIISDWLLWSGVSNTIVRGVKETNIMAPPLLSPSVQRTRSVQKSNFSPHLVSHSLLDTGQDSQEHLCSPSSPRLRFSVVHSHWSRNVEALLSLVERFIVLLRQLYYTIKNQLVASKAPY